MIWQRTWRADPRVAALADRHYSRKTPGAALFSPPGWVLVLVTPDGDACWVTWRTEHPDADWLRDAWCCTLFRNEAPDRYLSSDLVTAAVAATLAAWGEAPVGGTVTTVDATKVRAKRDPGRCFLRAGFEDTGIRTIDRGLVVLRMRPDVHPPPVEAAHTQQSWGMAA